MNKVRYSKLSSLVSTLLVVSFIAFDISWAHPDINNSQRATLSTEGIFQQKMMTDGGSARQSAVFAEMRLSASVRSIARSLLEQGLPLNYLESTLVAELKDVLSDGMDLSKVMIQGDVVMVWYKMNGRTYNIQIALKESPSVKYISGYELPSLDTDSEPGTGYIVKVSPEADRQSGVRNIEVGARHLSPDGKYYIVDDTQYYADHKEREAKRASSYVPAAGPGTIGYTGGQIITDSSGRVLLSTREIFKDDKVTAEGGRFRFVGPGIVIAEATGPFENLRANVYNLNTSGVPLMLYAFDGSYRSSYRGRSPDELSEDGRLMLGVYNTDKFDSDSVQGRQRVLRFNGRMIKSYPAGFSGEIKLMSGGRWEEADGGKISVYSSADPYTPAEVRTIRAVTPVALAAGQAPLAESELTRAQKNYEAAKEALLPEAQHLLDFLDGRSYKTKIGAPDFSPDDGFNPLILALGSPSPEAFVAAAKRWRDYSSEWKTEIPVLASTGRGRGTVSFIENTQYYYDHSNRPEAAKAFRKLRTEVGIEKLTEAEVMKFIFMQEGVPDNAIYLETDSTDTLYCVEASLDNVIDKGLIKYRDPSKPLKILPVADAFHQLRTQLTALSLYKHGKPDNSPPAHNLTDKDNRHRMRPDWQITLVPFYQPFLAEMDDGKLLGEGERLGYLANFIGNLDRNNDYGEIWRYREHRMLDYDDPGYAELREYLDINWKQARLANLRDNLLKRFIEAKKALDDAKARELAKQNAVDAAVSVLRDGVKRNFGRLLARGAIESAEYEKYIAAADTYDLRPFLPVIEKVNASGLQGAGDLLEVILSIVIAGYHPSIASDFDDTLTPLTKEMSEMVRDILYIGGKIAVLTGTPKSEIDRRAIDTETFMTAFSGNEPLLSNLYLLTKTATEWWLFKDGYRKAKEMSLAEGISQRDGNGNILPKDQWDPKRGKKLVTKYKAILKEAVDLFGLAEGIPGYKVRGKQIEDRGSQINIQVMGVDATDVFKNAYIEYERRAAKESDTAHGGSGKGYVLRVAYAAYINMRTGQLNMDNPEDRETLRHLQLYCADNNKPLPELETEMKNKIPVKAYKGGRTNIDGILIGLNKSWGMDQVSLALRQPAWTVVFSGDLFNEGGNDRPAMAKAGAVINVGDNVRNPIDNVPVINSDGRESAGLLPYYGIIRDVLSVLNDARKDFRYVGISMGGNKLAVSVNDGNDNIIGKPIELRWDDDASFNNGQIRDEAKADEVMDRLADMITDVIEANGIDKSAVRKIHASLAGPVDKEKGILGTDFKTPNLPFNKYSFSEKLAAKLKDRLIKAGIDICNDAEAARDGERFAPRGALRGLPGGVVIIGGGINISVDDDDIKACGQNIFQERDAAGNMHYVWAGDKTGGRRPIERGNTPSEIERKCGDIGSEFVALGEEAFKAKYPGYPMIDWAGGMRDFEDRLSGPNIRARIRETIDAEKRSPSADIDEYLAIERRAATQKRTDELERALTQEAFAGNKTAVRLIKEFASEIGLALAAFIAAHQDEEFVNHLVLVSGIGENMGRGVYEDQDDIAKGSDVFIKTIRQSVKEELLGHFNMSEQSARVDRAVKGIVRSDIGYERELVSYDPADGEVMSAYSKAMADKGAALSRSGQDRLNTDINKADASVARLADRLRALGKKSIADTLEKIYPMALPYLINASGGNPVDHAPETAETIAEIALGENASDRDLKVCILAALLHDVALDEKVRKADIEEEHDPVKKQELIERAIAIRTRHMLGGARISEVIINRFNAQNPELAVSADEIGSVKSIISVHDNPSVQEYSGTDDGRWLIPNDNMLAVYHREADRVWMLSYEGIELDLRRDEEKTGKRDPKMRIEQSIRRHREEYMLYARALGQGIEDAGFKGKTLYRTDTGYRIFNQLIRQAEERYGIAIGVPDISDVFGGFVNNERARTVGSANRLLETITRSGAGENLAGAAKIDRFKTTIEVKSGIEGVISAVESIDSAKVPKEALAEAGNIKNKIDQIEADGVIASLIILARKAKFEGQRLIIGLETDWIPGYSEDKNRQKEAMNPIIREIEELPAILRSMGLDNVVLIHASSGELASNITAEADRTQTSLSNVVILASKTTVTSDSFAALRSTQDEKRAFIAGIDPTELDKLAQEKEDADKPLNIKILELLSLVLDLASGKEPPNIPLISSYEKALRIVMLLPTAKPKDYEELKRSYTAQQTALAAA